MKAKKRDQLVAHGLATAEAMYESFCRNRLAVIEPPVLH